MQKFESRKKLNWFERFLEKRRIKKEIKVREKKIEEALLRIKNSSHRLMAYHRSGVPVHKMNISTLERNLKEFDKSYEEAVLIKSLEDSFENLPEVKPKAKRGRPRKAISAKQTKIIEKNFVKLNKK